MIHVEMNETLPKVAEARERDRLARERLARLGNDPMPAESTLSLAEKLTLAEFQRARRRLA